MTKEQFYHQVTQAATVDALAALDADAAEFGYSETGTLRQTIARRGETLLAQGDAQGGAQGDAQAAAAPTRRPKEA